MKKTWIIFIFLLAIFYFPLLKADVISVNSGGNNQLCMNPGGGVEDCFFSVSAGACLPKTCSTLGYNCDNWTDGCGGTINCGTCSSGYTCSSGICTSTAVPIAGTGGAGGAIAIPGISINPSFLNFTLSYNNVTNMSQRITQKIFITNNAADSKTVSISQSGLDSIAILSTNSLTINPGQTQELDIDFVAPLQSKDISGNIIINGYTVPVFIHVTSNPLWFDSNIVILNNNYQVSRGGTLKTQVDLIPKGEKSRLDVTLNYAIKDDSGKIYLTKSETVLVTDETKFERDFGTGMLPVGKYVISLELVYPGGVAPSSAYFEVIPLSTANIIGIIMFFLILTILIVAILIVVVLIKRRRDFNKTGD